MTPLVDSPLELRLPRPLAGLLARIAAPVYAAGLARRSARFDRGVGVQRVPVPVVSVGNLSLGGTGKTPAVAWLARALTAEGRRVAIALRGYAGRGRAGSDEADEYRRLLPDCPVLVGRDRRRNILEHLRSAGPPPDVVLLDDGFQHRQLARDVDLVLIDATKDPFAERLFPRGWLREPVGALARASAVIVTHAEAAEPAGLARLVQRLTAQRRAVPIAVCRHVWEGVTITPAGGGSRGEPSDDRTEPVAWLRGRGVVLACAIGNPAPFVAEAQRHARVLTSFLRPDHDPFDAQTVARLIGFAQAERAEAILVTEKDWSKLRHVPAERWPCSVVRPRLGLAFDRGGEAVLALVRAAAGRKPAPATMFAPR